MRFLIVQLSDCHFVQDRSRNALLSRVGMLTDAVAGRCMDVRACFLVFSGDLAFSGKPEEYALVKEFVSALQTKLLACRDGLAVHVLMVPGNHDCNFDKATQVREVLLRSLDVQSLKDASIVATCAEVQQPFFDFVRSLDECGPKAFSDHLVDTREYSIDGSRVRFLLLNSAWCSSLHEQQGSLRFPHASISPHEQDAAAPDAAIAVIHHPFNWLAADNARLVRDAIESKSDLVLTGHEHVSATYRKTGPRGEQNDFVEGGVLQSPGDTDDSSFNLIVIDTAAQSQTALQYRWHDGQYVAPTEQPVSRTFERNKRRLRSEFLVTDGFERGVLEDPGVNFTHPRVESLRLSDLYVYPDARRLRRRVGDEPGHLVQSRDLLSFVLEAKKALLLGDEQSGKTSLARVLFRDLRHNGVIPLLLNAKSLSKTAPNSILEILNASIDEQYGNGRTNRLWGLEKAKRAVIVDDFHDCPIARSKQHELLQSLEDRFGLIVLLGSRSIQLDLLASPSDASHALWSYQPCELLEFGQVRRHQLIQKWYMAGRSDVVDEDDVERQLIHLENVISSLLVRDLIPSHPIFVLTMLQALELATPLHTTSGSFGFLYEHLITASLQGAPRGHDHVNTHYSYLSEFAKALYDRRSRGLTESDAREWHRGYCDQLALDLSFDRTVETLVKCRLLSNRHGTIGFRYPFVYYYFVARFMSEHIGTLHVRSEVERLAKRLHNEEAANVVMFLCHLTKDEFVLTTVLENADSLFKGFVPCNFDSDVEFLDKLGADLPPVELPDGPSRENREKLLAVADEVQQQEAVDAALVESPTPTDLTDEAAVAEFAAQLNAAGKNIQILGQILRNFVGSLPQEKKVQLTRACYSLGLRTLSSIVKAVESSKAEMVQDCMKWLKEKHPQWEEPRLRQAACFSVFGVVEMMSLGMIKHVSNSVGLKDLSRVFSQVAKEDDTLAVRLITTSIRLDHFGQFPEDDVRLLAKDLRKERFAFSLVRALVWLHYYLYPTRDIGQKQSICAALDISIKKSLPFNPVVKKV